MSADRVESLEINQDLTFQRREWAIQRIGWAVMALIIVAALLGLFATGPLSSTSATVTDGALRVEHARFARHEALTTFRIEVSQQAVENGEVRIHASQSFLDTWSIDTMTPEPDSVTLEADGVTWAFPAGELGGSGQITLRARPDVLWLGRGEIGLVGFEPAAIEQLVYP